MPPFLEGLILSGRVVDLILGVLVLEVLGLSLLRRWVGLSPLALVIGALPGAALLLALKLALTGGAPPLIAGVLALSFVFHIADLALRRRNND